MRKILLGMLLAAAGPAMAEMEPGEWAFSSTATTKTANPASAGKPVTSAFQNCVRREDLGNPQRWLQRNQQTECVYTNVKRSKNGYGWTISCAKTGWTGTGSARAEKGTLQGQTRVGGAAGGRQTIEITTTITGKRIGPCRS